MQTFRFGPPPQYRGGSVEVYLPQLVNWLGGLVGELERVSQANEAPLADKYVITNLTKDRALDCDSTSTAELADVIGTLISDFQDRGWLRDRGA